MIAITAAGGSGSGPTFVDWVTSDGAATILAAFIAVAGIAITIGAQRRASSRERRAAIFAEALRAAEEYAEAPFLIARRGRSPESEAEVSRQINDIQSRLRLSRAMIQLAGPEELADAYARLDATLRRVAGAERTNAWNAKPRRGPLGKRWDRTAIDEQLAEVTRLMAMQV